MVCIINPQENTVKRIISMTNMGEVHVNYDRGQLLFRTKDRMESTLLVQWITDPQNQPSTLEGFVDSLKKLHVTRPGNGQLNLVIDPTDLNSQRKTGTKPGARQAMQDIVDTVKNSPRNSPAPSPQAAPQADPTTQYGAGSPGMSYDSDDPNGIADLQHNNLLDVQDTPFRPVDTRIAGSIQRRPSPRSGLSLGLPGPIQPSPRYVPGHWQGPSRSPQREEQPWEIHYSKSADGRPYWYNPLTGENTWTPPPGHSYPVEQSPARTRPPWIPAISASPNQSPHFSPQNSPSISPLPYDQPGSPINKHNAIAVLQHAAACSGTDVNELLEAANDIVGKRNLTYVSI